MSPNFDRIHFVTRHFNNLQGLRYGVPVGLITLSAGGTAYFANRPLVLLRIILLLGAFVLMLGGRRYYRHTFGEVEPEPIQPGPERYLVSIFGSAGSVPRLGFSRISPLLQRILVTVGLTLALLLIFQSISPTVVILADESPAQPPWLMLDAVALLKMSISSFSASAFLMQAMYALYGLSFLGIWLWRERRLSQSHYLALGALLLWLAALRTFLGFLVGEDNEIAWIVAPFLPAVIHLWMALLLCGFSMVLTGLLDHWQLAGALKRPLAGEE